MTFSSSTRPPQETKRGQAKSTKRPRTGKAAAGAILLCAVAALTTFRTRTKTSFLSSRTLLLDSQPTTTSALNPQSSPNGISHILNQQVISQAKWNLWDGETILGQEHVQDECEWVSFRGGPETRAALVGDHQRTLQMCVHPGPDAISNFVKRRGFWPDCRRVARAWRSDTTGSSSRGRIHLEVGANIGACILEALLAVQDVSIVAFEPNPINLNRLTSTLVQLPVHYKERVTLFPIALGAKSNQEELVHGCTNNLGHSVVGQPIPVPAASDFSPGLPTFVERLDDLILLPLQQDSTSIGVMKLDVQGYECQVLDGMPQVLNHVDKVLFECENRLQSAFANCSSQILLERLSQGRTIHDFVATKNQKAKKESMKD